MSSLTPQQQTRKGNCAHLSAATAPSGRILAASSTVRSLLSTTQQPTPKKAEGQTGVVHLDGVAEQIVKDLSHFGGIQKEEDGIRVPHTDGLCEAER